MKKCIIFDCDGVLVDSETLALKINAQYLSTLGWPISEEECAKLFIGRSKDDIQKTIRQIAGLHLTDTDFHKMHQRIFDAFDNALKPLLNQILENKEFSNINRCIASGSTKEWVCRALMASKQQQYFKASTVFSAQELASGKPAPDLFLFAAREMGYKPEDCIVIEDSVFGIEAALAAKMSVIGFLGGSHARYGWYQKRIKAYKIPIAFNQVQLNKLLKQHLLVSTNLS
jgi:HAD superfamily hydrolase (TIGR01509 family)